jgi:hypothetical protein
MRVFATTGLAAALLVATGASHATLADPKGHDTTFRLRNQQSFFVKRYPGDQAFAGGTVRMEGPEQGPYIERCHWTANADLLSGPLGLTQRCFRYTLENTPE